MCHVLLVAGPYLRGMRDTITIFELDVLHDARREAATPTRIDRKLATDTRVYQLSLAAQTCFLEKLPYRGLAMPLAGLQAASHRLPERKRPAPLQQQHLAVDRVDYDQDGKRAAEIGLLHALPRLLSSRVVPHSQAASFPVEALCRVAAPSLVVAVSPEGVRSLVEARCQADTLFPAEALLLVAVPSPAGAPCPADTPSRAEALFPVGALYPADTLFPVGAPIPWSDAPLPAAPWREQSPLPVTTGSGKAASFPTRS